MKLCRFTAANSPEVRVGLIANGRSVLDLTHADVRRMTGLIERADLVDELTRLMRRGLPEHALDSIRLLTPVESQEVWAAGVTYLRSRDARMEPALPSSGEGLHRLLRRRSVDRRRANRRRCTPVEHPARNPACVGTGVRRRDWRRTDQKVVHRARG